MLVEFAKNKFRIFFEVSLWLTLISCAISGAVTGYNLDKYHGSLGYGFLGLIFGTLIGLISTVIFGGLIATFLNIDINVENINANVEILKDNSFKAETSSEAKTPKTGVSSLDPLGLVAKTKVSPKDPLDLL